MEERITLGDGRVFESTHVIESEGTLFIYIYDGTETLRTVFDDLYENEGTASITALRYGEEETYTGYTSLISVRKETEGFITAGLRKGE